MNKSDARECSILSFTYLIWLTSVILPEYPEKVMMDELTQPQIFTPSGINIVSGLVMFGVLAALGVSTMSLLAS